MMGWELRDFHLERTGGLASPFQFEVLVDAMGKPSHILRGDGVVIRDSTVRINRIDQLARQAQALGLSPDSFLTNLEQEVAQQALGASQPAA
jgi:hypothetical protein